MKNINIILNIVIKNVNIIFKYRYKKKIYI